MIRFCVFFGGTGDNRAGPISDFNRYFLGFRYWPIWRAHSPSTNGGSGFRARTFHAKKKHSCGCKNHPVHPHIRFLDGRLEQFSQVALTRWKQLTDLNALTIAGILAVVAMVVIELLKFCAF
jgi:hypothetical protein